MQQPPAAPGSVCPRCRANNPPGQPACGACGGPLITFGGPPQMAPGQMPPGQMAPGQMMPGQMMPGQMMPEQMMPGQMPPGQMGPGMMGPGAVPNPERCLTVAADPMTAYSQALGAIQMLGGQVTWQNPPATAQFVISKKDFMNTGGVNVRYSGELLVSSMNPGQSMLALSLKPDWGSAVPLLAMMAVCMLVLFFMNGNMLWIMVGAVGCGMSAWNVANKLPNGIAKDVFRQLAAPQIGLPMSGMQGPAPGMPAPMSGMPGQMPGMPVMHGQMPAAPGQAAPPHAGAWNGPGFASEWGAPVENLPPGAPQGPLPGAQLWPQAPAGPQPAAQPWPQQGAPPGANPWGAQPGVPPGPNPWPPQGPAGPGDPRSDGQ